MHIHSGHHVDTFSGGIQDVLFIVSTFGNGDPPGGGEEFYANLKKGLVPKDVIQDLRFCVFALGSSAYQQFCGFGKNLDASIKNLGGIRILPVHCGDEIKKQEESFQLWERQLVKTLNLEAGISSSKSEAANSVAPTLRISQPSASLVKSKISS